MNGKMLALLTVGLLLGANSSKDDAAKTELEKFAGTWQAVSMEREGKQAPQEQVAKVKLIVKGDHYTLQMGDRTIQGTHKLDPTQNPKQIEAVRTEGPHAGETIKGIYTLEGDTYKVCFGASGKDRPTEFSTTSGGGHRLLVMKREKP